MTWSSSTPYAPWNVYRGDLEALKPTSWQETPGHWTQEPGSNALAAQDCAVSVAQHADTVDLAPGEVAFYLITGLTGSVENSLGQWGYDGPSLDEARINDNSCPE